MQDTLKQKLKWRSVRRAMLEIDLYFSQFIDHGGFDTLTDAELLIYKDLLEYDDDNLLILFQGKSRVSDIMVQCIIDKVRSYFVM